MENGLVDYIDNLFHIANVLRNVNNNKNIETELYYDIEGKKHLKIYIDNESYIISVNKEEE